MSLLNGINTETETDRLRAAEAKALHCVFRPLSTPGACVRFCFYFAQKGKVWFGGAMWLAQGLTGK